MAGRQPSSSSADHLLLGEQLSDEHFLMFDIDAAVTGAAAGSGSCQQKSVHAPSSRGQKRKEIVVGASRGIGGGGGGGVSGVDDLVQQNKKRKSTLKQTFVLSDSSDDEGAVGEVEDVEDSCSWGDETGGNIRSRNKGKAQQGALSLNVRKAASIIGSNGGQGPMEFDLTEDMLASEEEEAEVKEEGLVLSRKEKAGLREWLYAFRKRYHNYWVVLNNNSVHVS